MAASINRLAQPLDTNSREMAGLNYPGWVDVVVLSAGVAASYAVPTGARALNFSADANFYACYVSTAVVPTVAVTDGTASELNPGLRGVGGVTSISLISPTACKVTIAVFS